jgi:hypothetical protein
MSLTPISNLKNYFGAIYATIGDAFAKILSKYANNGLNYFKQNYLKLMRVSNIWKHFGAI